MVSSRLSTWRPSHFWYSQTGVLGWAHLHFPCIPTGHDSGNPKPNPWLTFHKGCSYDCLSEPVPLKATSRIHFPAGSVSSTRPTLGQGSPLSRYHPFGRMVSPPLVVSRSYHFPKPLLPFTHCHKPVFLLANGTQHSAKTMSSGPQQPRLTLTSARHQPPDCHNLRVNL